MIAADHDRRLETPLAHELVDAQAEARTLAITEPQDARGQPLERHPLAGKLNPADQRFVVPEHLERRVVGDADVVGIARERRPAERPLSCAEQRTDVLGHEAGNVERVGDACLLGLRADVVPVVERHGAACPQREHGADVVGHRRHRSRDVLLRTPFAQPRGFVQADASRHISIQRVVRRRLVRQNIRRDPASDQRRQHIRGVAAESDRASDAVAGPCRDAFQRLVEAVGGLIEIPSRQTPHNAGRIDLDHQRRGTVHGGGQGLGAAHPAQAGRDDQLAREGAAEMTTGNGGQRLVRALDDALTSDIDPASRRHLAEHGQAAVLEVSEVLPCRPCGHEQRVGDEHARRPGMRLEDANGFSGLHEQRFVVFERRQRSHDGVERRPVSRGLARSAVHDQIVRPFCDIGIQIVHQHPERSFLRPALAGQRGAAWRPDRACCSSHEGSRRER